MWRSSDCVENSYLEDPEADSSQAIDSTYDDLKNSSSFDISLYETTTTEAPHRDDDPLRLHTHESCSKESGYHTSEYLSIHEQNNDSFCDHISSIGLNEPLDEEIFDFCKIETPDIQLELPMDFNALINDGLAIEAVQSRSNFNTHKLSLCKKKSNKRSLSKSNEELPTDKQLKSFKKMSEFNVNDTHSDLIKIALQRSTTEPNLIGDFSKSCYLPIISGRHQDLKSIAASTMSLLVEGEFSRDVVFKIIDCRYPYEYHGGHVEGAINLYTKDMLIDTLLSKAALKETKCTNKRFLLIFHCEFSSNRAPTLYRFLRNFDRNYNEHLYPTLFYPEMYLLEGGYKDFFLNYSSLCLPKEYLPMNHPKYSKDLSYFRDKTKSSSDQFLKGNNKRLNFV